jgi:hypothetical protein
MNPNLTQRRRGAEKVGGMVVSTVKDTQQRLQRNYMIPWQGWHAVADPSLRRERAVCERQERKKGIRRCIWGARKTGLWPAGGELLSQPRCPMPQNKLKSIPCAHFLPSLPCLCAPLIFSFFSNSAALLQPDSTQVRFHWYDPAQKFAPVLFLSLSKTAASPSKSQIDYSIINLCPLRNYDTSRN